MAGVHLISITDRTASQGDWVLWLSGLVAPLADTYSERLANIATAGTLVTLVVIGGIASTFGGEAEPGLAEAAGGMGLVAGVAAALLVALRCGVRRNLVSDSLLVVVFGVFSLITIGSGGSRTGLLFLGSAHPLIAIILRGPRVAALWLSAVLAVGFVGLQLGVNQIELPLKPASIVIPSVMPAAFVLFTILAAGLFFVHDFLLAAQRRESDLQQSRRLVAEKTTEVAERKAAAAERHSIALGVELVEAEKTTEVAERKAAAARRDSDSLEVELDLLRTLSGSLAHDFNNHLCAIRGNAELAALDAADESDLAEALLEIQRSSDRAAGVVADLLVFGSRQASRLERVELRELVEEVSDSVTRELSDRIRLEVSGEPASVRAHANREQIKAAVACLARNALEAIGERSGEVQLRVGERKLQEVELDQCIGSEQLSTGEFAYIRVMDSGRGIPIEDRHRIFQPLFTTKLNGRGLGLNVVSEAAERNGGMVRVEHGESGTLFELLLPRDSNSDSPRDSFRPAELSLRGKRVLVVDDESMVRRVTTRMLKNNGAQFVEARDGFEAVELLRADPSQIDLVVLDVAMPGLSGEETLHALREIRSGLPAVVISGHATKEFDHLRALGEVATLRKPFTLQSLAAAVADLMYTER